ncbi:MAG: type I restriction enzyme HsdR N-terminal domain-containing protein [Bacteroidota bacterium]|jgi:hypothetical protein
MIELVYPEVEIRERQQGSIAQLFDPFRKSWVQRTPEEWVRQQVLQLLTVGYHYPSSLITVEKSIQVGLVKKRFDILVYDAAHAPWMLIECKAPTVKLDHSVFEQVVQYNMGVPVSYLLIINGPYCLGWHRKEGQLTPLNKIPDFSV